MGERSEAGAQSDSARPAILLKDVTRVFERRSGRGFARTKTVSTAVDRISLTVERGEIVGWLGPNGAGKSTTIKMCTGILVPTSGQVHVLGLDPVAERRSLAARIGVVFGQRSQLWWDLPLGDSFELLHRIHRTEPASHARQLEILVGLTDLGANLAVPVRQLSLGQRMRGELVAALLHRPELLFLDEPTIGLDVVSKHAIHNALLDLRSEYGVTIVLTTHDLGDVRKLCDRVTVIDHGRIALDTDLDGLFARAGTTRKLLVTFENEPPESASTFVAPGVTVGDVVGVQMTLEVDLDVSSIPAALQALAAFGPMVDLSVEERDIEAVVRELYRSLRTNEGTDTFT
jgi:ABC-2 type transport system ATP-binding protein